MIDIDALGATRRVADHEAPLDRALDGMEDACDDAALATAWARKALKIEPCCLSALLVLAEHAATPVERVALLKEAVSTHQRAVLADPTNEIASYWDVDAKPILAAIALLGDELAEMGDIDGAAGCYREVIERDDDDRLDVQRSMDVLMAGRRLPLKP
ncbi:MAG: hypothetical protein NXI18_20265 [Alphaproteobacteria bacterium]|nr:hypothetical protein [Alphaproteobacteria bacterium]